MPFAFTLDVPANAEIYGEIRAKLGDETPQGLIAHVVQSRETGLRYIDVWESEAQWAAFRDATLVPTVTEVLAGYGIAHEQETATFELIDVIDAWVQEPNT
jgi:hypothetical protein